MAIDYLVLKAELTAGHPDTGAYNIDDGLAADELNAVNRPSPAPLLDVLQYIVERNHRTQQGTDTTFTTILGRLEHAARSSVGDDPFGRGVGNELTLIQLHACLFFASLFASPQINDIDYGDTNLPTGQVNGAGVWSSAHATDIEALSQNQQSRATEIGIDAVIENDVTRAREV